MKSAIRYLFKEQVRYLGHKVSRYGYCMDDDDKAAVLALNDKCPTKVGELRQILVFVGYYRKYIPDFSRKAFSLYALLNEEEQDQDTQSVKVRERSRKEVTTQDKPLHHNLLLGQRTISSALMI